jgi:hemerythrin superfamily protein
MKATLLLRKDHEKIHELFEKFGMADRPDANGKRGLFEEIRRELTLHLKVENEVFYSALRDHSTTKSTVELVDSLSEDHDKIERLLEEIENSENNDKLMESNVIRLIEFVDAHIQKEEDQLYGEARRVFSEQRLEELGLEMEHRRRIFTQVAA